MFYQSISACAYIPFEDPYRMPTISGSKAFFTPAGGLYSHYLKLIDRAGQRKSDSASHNVPI